MGVSTAIKNAGPDAGARYASAYESFTVEYVTNSRGGGYNWYKGNFHSLIQVNTDLPIYIDRAVDLAAHEGIPAITFTIRCSERIWSTIAAGWSFRVTHCSHRNRSSQKDGEFGREVASLLRRPNEVREGSLVSAAGIDSKRADEYYAVQDLMKQLDYAANESARED